MYQTLSTSEAVDILLADTDASWSLAGARALVEYLEQTEDETGYGIEFEPVAIRCEYSEYPSAIEAASDMSEWEYRPDELGADYDEEDAEEHARLYLLDRTTVIPFDGGVIVQSF